MEFLDWSILASHTGALTMVLVITQLTKNIGVLKKIPTQIWSYAISLMVLYPAYYFTGQLNASNAVLIIFNGMIIALSSNGGFAALSKAFPKLFKSE